MKIKEVIDEIYTQLVKEIMKFEDYKALGDIKVQNSSKCVLLKKNESPVMTIEYFNVGKENPSIGFILVPDDNSLGFSKIIPINFFPNKIKMILDRFIILSLFLSDSLALNNFEDVFGFYGKRSYDLNNEDDVKEIIKGINLKIKAELLSIFLKKEN